MSKTTGESKVGRFGLMFAALLLGALAISSPATAAAPVVTGSVTVTEHEPSFSDLVDIVSIVPGGTAEITSGDGTNIGGSLLLDGEFIDVNSTLGSNTILFSIRGTGNVNALGHPSGFLDTGYTSTAQYLFTGFTFSSPGHIIGATASSPDSHVSDLGTLNLAFTDNSITMNFGGLGVFGSSTNLGQLLVTISTESISPVPEPATFALLGAGLIVVGWRTRRTRS